MVAICERRRYPHAALLTLHHGAHAFAPDGAALPKKPLVADKKGMCNRRNGPATARRTHHPVITWLSRNDIVPLPSRLWRNEESNMLPSGVHPL